jgi:hypothetical protein
MYGTVYIKPDIGEVNSSKYLRNNNSVTWVNRSESSTAIYLYVFFRSWETLINFTPVSEIVPEIHMQSLVPGNEYYVPRKLAKFKQVGSPTNAVVRTGLNGAQWRHCYKVLVSFIINCLYERLMYCCSPQVFYVLFISNYATRLSVKQELQKGLLLIYLPKFQAVQTWQYFLPRTVVNTCDYCTFTFYCLTKLPKKTVA